MNKDDLELIIRTAIIFIGTVVAGFYLYATVK
jgi:hypothetical protein